MIDARQIATISAVHRLREIGVLKMYREGGVGAVYTIAPGATRPMDGRGRPRKSEQPTRRLESSPVLDSAGRAIGDELRRRDRAERGPLN